MLHSNQKNILNLPPAINVSEYAVSTRKPSLQSCCIIISAIWHILTDLKPYTPEGFLDSRPVNKEKVLTTSQALNLLKQRGYFIKDDPLSVS